jgi:hypothetical protein
MKYFNDGLDVIWATASTANIGQYIYVFAASFVIVAALKAYNYPLFAQKYHAAENGLIGFLRNRELFHVDDSVREEVWLNILRILVGYMLFQRSFWIFYYEISMGTTPARSLISFLDMTASFAVMIGILTPIFLGFLFLFHTYVHDSLLGSFTLGSCLAQILLMILLFVPTGRRLSLDAVIMSSRHAGARLIEGLYAFVGLPTTNRITIVKFCAFISYGLLCMYSVYEHFNDPYWFNGTANVMLLANNWLVGPHEFFREIFSAYGKPVIIFSMVALYIMMFWEFVIIPFTLMKGAPR